MDMIQMIKSFPNQILEQYENLKNEELDLNKFNNIDNIIIAGMGGSAISGDLVNALTKNEIVSISGGASTGAAVSSMALILSGSFLILRKPNLPRVDAMDDPFILPILYLW